MLPPTATPGGESPKPLPDLIIGHAKIELETGGSCAYASTQLGVRLTVENAGNADAGPFVIDVYGTQQAVDSGLAAGQTVSLWQAGTHGGDGGAIVVDATQQVVESDESNNSFAQMLPIPTLPIPCTPPADAVQTSTPAPPPSITPVPQQPTVTPVQKQPTLTPVPLPIATTEAPPRPSAVLVREAQVTIPTYPYADFVQAEWSESFNMPYPVLDREAYKAFKSYTG